VFACSAAKVEEQGERRAAQSKAGAQTNDEGDLKNKPPTKRKNKE
jgi:hypothetical protein